MKILFRIPRGLVRDIHADLNRPHAFALERVGFLSCRQSILSQGLAILAERYHPVADLDYVDDPTCGAVVGASGFRNLLSLYRATAKTDPLATELLTP